MVDTSRVIGEPVFEPGGEPSTGPAPPAPPPPDRLFQRVFSEFLDWDEPPLFKRFLRVDASSEEIRIRGFAATGWRADELDPPVEDEVRIGLVGRVSLPQSAVRGR